ncbi:MAG TPA: serine protease [Burkholderiaceae bacterium]|nr:serine protease [Burkholderiaceae bacterium]
MTRVAFGLRPVVLVAALIAAASVPAQGDTLAAGPDAPSSVSAQGRRIVDATRAQLLQVRTLLKEQDSQASVGSGFVVDASGLAITNYHVVSQFALRPDRYRLAFTMAQGRTGSAELLAIDVIHDLALLRLRGADAAQPIDFVPLTFRGASLPVSKGERLYSLGNPLDVGFAVVEGVYNGLVERSFLPQVFFGGSLNPGMSGGPTVDDAGRVIGINVATRRDGEQVSFLVPGALANELLQRGRDAKAQRQPMYAEVTRQLKAHQAALVDAFVAQPWRSANHPRYRVPVPQETFMRCWGSASPETQKYMRFERSDCVMNHSVYASPQLRAGMINVRHEIYDGDRLGTLRFAQEYSASFANEVFGSGFGATAPRCKEGFTDRDGLVLRTVACISALKRFEGLYNLSVLTTTVDQPTQGVQGRLDAVAVDFDNALRLTAHYLQGFGWNPKIDPR